MSSKRSSSPAAGDIIEGNDDLLIEILLFLPAIFLVKFKSVSKRWRSLISAPSFCRRHTLHHPRRQPETQTLFIVNSHRSKHYVSNPTVHKLFSFRFHFGFPLVEILRSCNGLLLLRCRETKRSCSRYYVFNPTTKQRRDLSPLPTCTNPALYLMFDPSQSPHYKVVCFTGHRSTDTSRNVYLYDSESHHWKHGVIDNMRWGARKGIHFNGGIYFHRFRHSSTRFVPEGNVIEATLAPPRHQCHGRQKNYVMESNGFMLCLTLAWKSGSNVLHVSEMKKGMVGSGWRNKYRADMNRVLAKGVSCVDAMELLGVVWGEREEDLLVLLRLSREIMVYRFCDGVFEVMVHCNSEEFQEEKPLWCMKDVHHFMHTLALV